MKIRNNSRVLSWFASRPGANQDVNSNPFFSVDHIRKSNVSWEISSKGNLSQKLITEAFIQDIQKLTSLFGEVFAEMFSLLEDQLQNMPQDQHFQPHIQTQPEPIPCYFDGQATKKLSHLQQFEQQPSNLEYPSLQITPFSKASCVQTSRRDLQPNRSYENAVRLLTDKEDPQPEEIINLRKQKAKRAQFNENRSIRVIQPLKISILNRGEQQNNNNNTFAYGYRGQKLQLNQPITKHSVHNMNYHIKEQSVQHLPKLQLLERKIDRFEGILDVRGKNTELAIISTFRDKLKKAVENSKQMRETGLIIDSKQKNTRISQRLPNKDKLH